LCARFFGWGGEALCIKSAPSGLLAAFFALLSYPKDHLIPFF
jgi:hypothetical protein